MLNVPRIGRQLIVQPGRVSASWYSGCLAHARSARPATSIDVRRSYHHQASSRFERESRLPRTPPGISSRWTGRESSPSAVIPGSINERLARLKEAGQNAEYNLVKILVESLVVDGGYKPDASLYAALILANADPEHGSAQEISHWYEDMERADVPYDSAIYTAILKSLAIHPDQLLRDEILRKMRDRWYSLSGEDHHFVAAGLIRERKLEQAIEWLQQMREGGIGIDTWLYDLLIYSLCDVQEIDEALAIMKYRMDHEGRDSIPTHGDQSLKEFISPNVWYHFLDSASRAMHIQGTKYAYNARVTPGYINPPAGMCQNILVCASNSGDTKLATSIFSLVAKRSGNPIQLHHFEILTEAYVRSGDLKTAMTLLCTAQRSGHIPVKASTRSILVALRGSHFHTKAALQYLEELRDQDRGAPIAALNVLIEAFILLNDIDRAFRVYKSISSFTSPSLTQQRRLSPDTETFNLLLEGCCQRREKAKAMFLVSELVALNVNPDASTYDTLVRICMRCDAQMDDAWKYVSEAREANFEIRKSTLAQLEEGRFREKVIVQETVEMIDEPAAGPHVAQRVVV